MSLPESLEDHFCLSVEATRSRLRGALAPWWFDAASSYSLPLTLE
jgi:hypothetical protein